MNKGNNKPAACRHRDTWLLGNVAEWCYRCGAVREMERVAIGSESGVTPASKWTKPVGVNGINPAMKEADRKL